MFSLIVPLRILTLLATTGSLSGADAHVVALMQDGLLSVKLDAASNSVSTSGELRLRIRVDNESDDRIELYGPNLPAQQVFDLTITRRDGVRIDPKRDAAPGSPSIPHVKFYEPRALTPVGLDPQSPFTAVDRWGYVLAPGSYKIFTCMKYIVVRFCSDPISVVVGQTQTSF